MKVGMVIQRYGLDVAGGAELHCRLVAEHLAPNYQVEVFTTCARDYVSWKNYYPQGLDKVNGIKVHRFPVKKGRNIRKFEDIQNLVFHEKQNPEMENRWLKENGPYCPGLISAVKSRTDIDVWILFSYRYWTTAEALRYLGKKALLVPTAEHDPALYLGVVSDLFHMPGAIIYNSVEEKQLINKISGNHQVPGDIVGVGLIEPESVADDIKRAAVRFKELDPYILYIGRIDKNKGCDHMFRMFKRYCEEKDVDLTLALIGKTVIPIPEHSSIDHLGFLSEAEKNAALQHCRLLVMPSQYESLSMVLLEAWMQSRPAIVNAKCEVLKGQCLRSNGGLPYANYDEFAEALSFLINHRELAEKIGESGHKYYDENYRWSVIETKYDQLIKLVVTEHAERNRS